MISIIIRTKNEERWITACLTNVFSQDYQDFEVIIVDNESSDKTLEKASQFNIAKVISCKEFRPGLALNMGIREANGESKYIVCLSGHCIPINNIWLSNLLRNFDSDNVAAVYGRQEPLAFTSDSDKRDLSIIFGLDKKVQIRDSFFHNANSIVRKDLWEMLPFDETVTNIEDRIWAEKIIHRGYKLIYEPEASVYHYHGINHSNDKKRCANVVNILEKLNPSTKHSIHVNVNKLNIVSIIPVKGNTVYIKGKPFVGYTVNQALMSNYIKKVIISTDNPDLANLMDSGGDTISLLRDKSFSKDYMDIEKVIQYSLTRIEDQKIYPDLVVYLEITYPFRPRGLIDAMIDRLIKDGFDSVIAAKKEFQPIWKKESGKIERVDTGNIPRKYKDPCYIGLKGICTVTHPEFIREGTLFGEKIGIYEVNDPLSSLEIREERDFKIAELLLE